VPENISRAKDERLQALGVERIKLPVGGSELILRARQIADERGGYLVHPHLDPSWTNGYAAIAEEILGRLPDCRSLVLPVGGGGLLMGLTEYLARHPAPIRLFGCEPFNYPTYTPFDHARTATIADGLLLENPHPTVQQRIAERGVSMHLVQDADIRTAMAGLYDEQGILVEPSSAITAAFVRRHPDELEEPVCLIFTGENITREDFHRLIAR
jgi:threonine dehydratase